MLMFCRNDKKDYLPFLLPPKGSFNKGSRFSSKLDILFWLEVCLHCPGYGSGVVKAIANHYFVALAFHPGF